MMTAQFGEFDRGFVPDAKAMNVVFGLLVGEQEAPSSFDIVETHAQAEWPWIEANLPSAELSIQVLVERG